MSEPGSEKTEAGGPIRGPQTRSFTLKVYEQILLTQQSQFDTIQRSGSQLTQAN